MKLKLQHVVHVSAFLSRILTDYDNDKFSIFLTFSTTFQQRFMELFETLFQIVEGNIKIF